MSDETRDMEALAEVFVGWWITGRSQLDRDQANALADGVLRSDWLAEHDAKVRAEERERIAQAIEAATLGGFNGWHQALAEAARIAREGGADHG